MTINHIAPSAQDYFDARSKNRERMEHEDYMDLAQCYADFIVEFEKMDGDIRRCHLWPSTRVGRMVDY